MERGVMLYGTAPGVGALWRFPAALGLALAASLAITSHYGDRMIVVEGPLRAFPWAVALRLFSEVRLPRFPGLLPWAAVLLALPFEGPISGYSTSLMIGGAGLLAIVAALPQAWDRRANGLWAQGLLLAIAVALAAVILLVGGCLLIFAILDHFFDTAVFERWLPSDNLLSIAMLLGPWVALSLWPRPGGEPLRWPSLAEALLNWLLVPFTLACAALLNLYCLQIAVAGEIPRGVVAPTTVTLVLCGGGVWALACASEARAARWLTRWFWLLLLLPTVALMVAAWQRVAQYGLTEARYLLFLCAAVVLVMAGVQAARRTLPTPSLAALVGSVALALAAMGPWGATAVSVRSQFAGLLDALDQAGLMRDGRIVLRDAGDPVRSEPRAASALKFLIQRGRHDLVVQRLDGPLELPEGTDLGARIDRERRLAIAIGLQKAPGDARLGTGEFFIIQRAVDGDYFQIGGRGYSILAIDGYDHATALISLSGPVSPPISMDSPWGLLDVTLTSEGTVEAQVWRGAKAAFDLSRALKVETTDPKVPLIVNAASGGTMAARLLVHRATWHVSADGVVSVVKADVQLLFGRAER